MRFEASRGRETRRGGGGEGSKEEVGGEEEKKGRNLEEQQAEKRIRLSLAANGTGQKDETGAGGAKGCQRVPKRATCCVVVEEGTPRAGLGGTAGGTRGTVGTVYTLRGCPVHCSAMCQGGGWCTVHSACLLACVRCVSIPEEGASKRWPTTGGSQNHRLA